MIAAGQFSWRSCFSLDLSVGHAGKIERCFDNGFDAVLGDSIVYFTSDSSRLNPLAILLPAQVIAEAVENEILNLSAGALQIGQKRLQPGPEIADLPMIAEICQAALAENLRLLHSNIKLFGRSSPVKDLVLGCNTQQNLLAPAESLLFEFPPDFSRLKELLGCGEGLTPAFDDLLSGMLLADRRSGRNCLVLPGDFFAVAGKQTTRQALQQLQFAAAGFLNPGFEGFVDEFLTRKVKSAEIVKMLNMGHSSGTDLLCGVWLYLTKAFSAVLSD